MLSSHAYRISVNKGGCGNNPTIQLANKEAPKSGEPSGPSKVIFGAYRLGWGGYPILRPTSTIFARVINKFHSRWLCHKPFATQKMAQGQEMSNKIHEFSASNLQLRDIIGIGFVTQSSTSWHFCQARLEISRSVCSCGFSFLSLKPMLADLGVTIYRNCPWISYGEVSGWNPRTLNLQSMTASLAGAPCCCYMEMSKL